MQRRSFSQLLQKYQDYETNPAAESLEKTIERLQRAGSDYYYTVSYTHLDVYKRQVKALGAGDVVSSPTFALVNEYVGRLTVEHFDMYRVGSWDDLYSTGFFDYLDTDSVLVIEWSENIENALPENVIRVEFQNGGQDCERKIVISGWKGRL